MMIFYRHWAWFRRVATWMAALIVFALSVRTLWESPFYFMAVGWVIAFALLCFYVFVVGYGCPAVVRLMTIVNHKVYETENPTSTWVQKLLFWLSMVGIVMQLVEWGCSNESSGVNPLQYALGLCACLGLFAGSGDFLQKEFNRLPH